MAEAAGDLSEGIPLGLADVEAAARRIAGHVRRTPLLEALGCQRPALDGRLLLKLENLQIIGAFKARGALNATLSLPPERLERGIITASGGNHGLAVAYAGQRAGVRTLVYVPCSTPEAKAEKIRAWGAEVLVEGSVWDEAAEAAVARAAAEGLTYLHPFAEPAVIAGQGTTALEILTDAPEADTLLVAIGGGGLISGCALAAKSVKPGIRVVGIEPVGAPTLKRSLEAGGLVTLPEVATRAGTLAPKRSAEINLEICRRHVDQIVLVDDEAMAEAARWLWFELGIAAELSGAAAVAALLAGAYRPKPGENVSAIVCGAGTDGLD